MSLSAVETPPPTRLVANPCRPSKRKLSFRPSSYRDYMPEKIIKVMYNLCLGNLDCIASRDGGEITLDQRKQCPARSTLVLIIGLDWTI